MTRSTATMLTWMLAFTAAAAQTPPPGATTPLGYLAEMLRDEKRANPTLATLATTGDKDLTAVLAAMSRSGDKKRRLFAVATLSDLLGKEARPYLLERVNYDPVMAIRAESLARLIAAKSLTAQQIADALKIPDEHVQCLAARALVDLGQSQAAIAALEKVAASKEPSAAAAAQMCLLGLGKREHEVHLRKVMRDPATPQTTLTMLLHRIERQKIKAAMGLALHVAAGDDQPTRLRVLGYRAVSAVSDIAAATLRDAIASSKRMELRVRLLNVLATRDDAAGHLKQLAAGQGAVAVLSRFELARQAGGPTATPAVQAALDLEHPVVVAYVLDRVGKDIDSRGNQADFYTPALARYIASVTPRPRQMSKEHFFAAGASARLVELGTPSAVAALKKLLARPGGDAVVRSAITGLLRSKTPLAGQLAAPLLNSPYDELATDAALALGHHGDPAARAGLRGILANRSRHDPALVVLASWYLLKIDKQTASAADQLAKIVK